MNPDSILRRMRRLTHEQVGRVVLALLAVLSFGVASATLGTTTGPDETLGQGRTGQIIAEGNNTSATWIFFDFVTVERSNQTGNATTANAPAGNNGVVNTDVLGLIWSGALVVGLGLLIVIAVFAIVRATGGETGEITPEADEESGDVAAVGRAAGRAADRIAVSASLNEVYRAWREMADHLDVSNPRASTPGEFATAAVDAGMVREDVRELTSLFERARYSEDSISETHEERAIAALRRIEQTYTDANSDENQTEEDDS